MFGTWGLFYAPHRRGKLFQMAQFKSSQFPHINFFLPLLVLAFCHSNPLFPIDGALFICHKSYLVCAEWAFHINIYWQLFVHDRFYRGGQFVIKLLGILKLTLSRRGWTSNSLRHSKYFPLLVVVLIIWRCKYTRYIPKLVPIEGFLGLVFIDVVEFAEKLWMLLVGFENCRLIRFDTYDGLLLLNLLSHRFTWIKRRGFQLVVNLFLRFLNNFKTGVKNFFASFGYLNGA